MPNRATLGVPERPVTPLHFTVEPPGTADRLTDLDPDQLLSVLGRLRELTTALARVHGCGGFNLMVNDGRHTGQSIGEVPEENRRLRFHVLGRRADESVAPTTILHAPDDFPLEPISEAERTARVRRLTHPEPGTDPGPTDPNPADPNPADPDATGPAPGEPEPAEPATAEATTTEACSLCGADDQELVRNDTARVIRPQRPLIPANVMLLPLRHVTHLGDLSDGEFVGLFRLFDRVAATFGQVHGSTSFNLFANDGRVAGQHVPHLHVHVLGRSEHEETDPYQLLRGLRFNLRR